MKILVLQSELGVLRGGGENFTRNLFGVLAKRGYETSAVFVANPSGFYPVPLPTGITPIPLPGSWSRKPGQRTLSLLARYMPPGGRASAALRRVKDSLDWRGALWHDQRFHRRARRTLASVWNEFDAIYVHGNLELAVETSRYRPTILRLPGPLPAEKAPLLRSLQVVCANGDALAQLQRFMGDEVIELPAGLDVELFGPGQSSVRAELAWTKDHKVIGYVGRLTQLKGVDLLADAFLRLISNMPEARLILIGHGEEEGRLRHVLAKEISKGIVHMVPGLNTVELVPWYRAMDVFVLPSRYENFSNALLEAAACGIPFIASDIGGNRTLQESGGGILFRPSSSEDLLLRMREFFLNMESAQARSLAFASTVRQRYNWDASADRLEWILESRLTLKSLRASQRIGQRATMPSTG